MKHLLQEQLVDHYYGSGGKPAERHLADCYECRQQFADLQRTLSAIVPAAPPQRGPHFGEEIWAKVRPQLPESGPVWSWWRMPWQWVPIAAIAALVAIAFFLGRQTAPKQHQTATLPKQVVRERLLMVALGDHLERSQEVLLEVAHASDAADVNLVRGDAEDLVGSNRIYRQSALKIGDRKTADVLDQLERVLLEIAHSTPNDSSVQIDELRRQIEDQGLLFKVHVIHSNVQNELLPSSRKNAAPAKTRPIA